MSCPVSPAAESYSDSAYCTDHLVPFIEWLLDRHKSQGGVTALRLILGGSEKVVWCGAFDKDHVDDLIDQLQPYDDGPRDRIHDGDHPSVGEANIYVMMNPARPDVLDDCPNGFRRGGPGAGDTDVPAVTMVVIDIDPVRPSGVSATDAEKAAASGVADRVADWLRARGVRAIRADSGNGFHLLIPTVPYHDTAAASARIRTLLRLLDREFSTDAAKVDTGVFKPSQLIKVYGSLAMKGSSTAERPHRYATVDLSDVPPDVDLFALLKGDLDASGDAGAAGAPTPRRSAAGSAPARAARSGGRGGWDFGTSCMILEAVLDRGGFEVKRVDKPEHGRILAFHECPVHTDHDGDRYECSVIVRPDGSLGAKCMHDDSVGWADFKEVIGWEAHVAPVLEELGVPARPEYEADASGIYHLRSTPKGTARVRLTNFTALIVGHVVRDDGAERTSAFEVRATLNGKSYQFTVPAEEYAAMNWVLSALGPGAVVYPGQGVKDQARAGIQILSREVPNQIVHAHTGWSRHGEVPVYCHAGGAIGPEGAVSDVRVELPAPIAALQLPEPPEGVALREAVRASLRVLETAPDDLTVPLLAAAYRAPLGGCDFSVFVSGESGAGKTATALLVQQHFGAGFDVGHMPANWSSTANANEGLAHAAKDALLMVDDFAPNGAGHDQARLNRDADRLFRNTGNGAGRGRMRADGSLRPPKPPRALLVATGEDLPRGQSVRARLLALEFGPNSVNWPRLTERQAEAAAGLYAAAMAGYVRWLAARHPGWTAAMPGRVQELRARAAASGQHRRTPGIVAQLQFAVEQFAAFAAEAGALTADEAEALRVRCWEALGRAADRQAALQGHCDPVPRFLELLKSALASGRAHVASVKGDKPNHAGAWGWRVRSDGGWEGRGARVGWVVDGDLYLDPQAAYAAAYQLASDSGETVEVGATTLHKRLHDRGLLVTTEPARRSLLVRRTLGGMQRGVLHLAASVLGQAGDDTADGGQADD